MLKADRKYESFTSADAGEFRLKWYRLLFETFFQGLHVLESFDPLPKTSLYNSFSISKTNFLEAAFEISSHQYVNFNDPAIPLFLFLENCYDIESAKQLLNLVAACYNKLHEQDSIFQNISHTEIIQSDVVFLDACKFIRVATKFVKAKVHVEFLFSLDDTMKFPDVDKNGEQKEQPFNARLSFLAKPYFFFVVLSLIEHVGMYNRKPIELIGYHCRDKVAPADPPKEWNMINFFTNCIESPDRSSEKVSFLKLIGFRFIKCICDKTFPTTYVEFKEMLLYIWR